MMVSVPKSVDAWIDFTLFDTNGDLLAGADLGTFVIWYLKQDNATLDTKTLTPGVNLKEVSNGVYSVQFLAAELDTVGVFVLLIEATGARQQMHVIAVVDESGVEGGVLIRSESWLPWHGILGNASTGAASLTPASCHYKKAGDNVQVAKTLAGGDLRDLGRGLYSIRFTAEELDAEGPFSYIVLAVGVDPFTHLTDVVLGTSDEFTFTVLLNEVAASGYDIQIRNKETKALVETVTSAVDGKVTAYLTRGTYYATLVNGTIVFDTNNVEFTVTGQPSANALTLDAAGLTPTVQSTPTTVTGSATLQTPGRNPIIGRTIRVTMWKPTLTGGVLLMGTEPLVTNEVGYAEVELEPGMEVDVTVEGTRINRTFTVPAVDFNLLTEALAVADPLVIQTPTFPVAPVHS